MPSPIILHHFDESPFSEKIRIVFGLKDIAWTSVRITRIMPRPDLMPMTGGYRRTPVMQIGADIYCDSQCILRELERRFPQPTLAPGGNAGLAWATAMWTDRSFFQNTVNLVFGSLADKVPQDFIADREKLRGAKFDVAAMTAAIPQMRDQVRAHLQWIETPAWRRPALAGRRQAQPDRRQRLYERLVRPAEHGRRRRACWRSSATRGPGKRGCARSATAAAAKCRPPTRSSIAKAADAADRRSGRSQRSERPQARRPRRGHARRLRQDQSQRRDRRPLAAAHRDPPA